ncbi:MAG: hypothetical protein Q7S32_04170 [bacterium]|nr:hypothetical protein [bacterium]
MRVGKFLVITYSDQDWEKAKEIIESKGHQAFRGETTDDLQQFTCWWGKTTREDRCKVDGVYVVGKPNKKTSVIPSIAAEWGCFLRNMHNDGTVIHCLTLSEDNWGETLQRSMMKAEDCPDPEGR